MICIVALIIFSILGIFSLSYRKLAKEAFDCVFRRITFRPCDTGFDQKIKGRVVGKLLNRSPKMAKAVHRFWEPISWFLVVLFFVSLFFSAKSVYNLVKYQSCNPKNPQSCILTTEQKEICECQGGKIACKETEKEKDTCKEGKCDNCAICEQK